METQRLVSESVTLPGEAGDCITAEAMMLLSYKLTHTTSLVMGSSARLDFLSKHIYTATDTQTSTDCYVTFTTFFIFPPPSKNPRRRRYVSRLSTVRLLTPVS